MYHSALNHRKYTKQLAPSSTVMYHWRPEAPKILQKTGALIAPKGEPSPHQTSYPASLCDAFPLCFALEQTTEIATDRAPSNILYSLLDTIAKRIHLERQPHGTCFPHRCVHAFHTDAHRCLERCLHVANIDDARASTHSHPTAAQNPP
jgi:hypothetical protein